MPIYQTNNYTLLQIKEKNFIENSSPHWIKHKLHTHTHTHTHAEKKVKSRMY